MTMKLWLVFAAVTVLAGCVRPVSLHYLAPQQNMVATRPLIGTVTVVDERGGAPAEIGAVMGPDGKPLKTLVVSHDIANVVGDIARHALFARNELTPNGSGPYELRIELLGLDAQQWADRQAQVDIVVSVVDRRTGRRVFVTRTYAEQRGDNYLAEDNQFLGSPAALSRDESETLARAIDSVLDHAALVIAMN